MKPVVHPAAQEVTLEGILHALSDPVRVRIFAQIARARCPQSCSAVLEVSGPAIPKSTLSLHFRILREAGLIRSERKGVELHNTPRCDDVGPRFGKVIAAIMEAHAAHGTRKPTRARARKR